MEYGPVDRPLEICDGSDRGPLEVERAPERYSPELGWAVPETLGNPWCWTLHP